MNYKRTNSAASRTPKLNQPGRSHSTSPLAVLQAAAPLHGHSSRVCYSAADTTQHAAAAACALQPSSHQHGARQARALCSSKWQCRHLLPLHCTREMICIETYGGYHAMHSGLRSMMILHIALATQQPYTSWQRLKRVCCVSQPMERATLTSATSATRCRATL